MIEIDTDAINECCISIFEDIPSIRVIETLKHILDDFYEMSFTSLKILESHIEKNQGEIKTKSLLVKTTLEIADFFSEIIEEENTRKIMFLEFVERIIFNIRPRIHSSLPHINTETLRRKLNKLLASKTNIQIDKNMGILINCCKTDKISFSFRYDIPVPIIRLFIEGVNCYSKDFFRSGYMMCAIAFEAVLKHHYEKKMNKSTYWVGYVDNKGIIRGRRKDIKFSKLLVWAKLSFNPTKARFDYFFNILNSRNSIAHLKVLEDVTEYDKFTKTLRTDFPNQFSIVVDYINNIYKTLIE